MMARIASAGTIFIPGKLKGGPSERTSRWIKTQQAAQQSIYINKTAIFESTASFSNVPLTDSTKHMFNSQTLAKLKPGVRIINCARGGIIDEKALAEAIKAGQIKGAALDVFCRVEGSRMNWVFV